MCHSHVSPCHSYILLLGKVVPLFVEITRDFVWEESMSSQQPLFSMSSFVTSLKIMKTAAKQANIQLQFLNSVTSMHLSPQVAYAERQNTTNKLLLQHSITFRCLSWIYSDTPRRLKCYFVTLILTDKHQTSSQEEPNHTISLLSTVTTLSSSGETSCCHRLSPAANGNGCDRSILEKSTAI